MRKLVIRGKFHHISLNLEENGEIIESYREDPTQNMLVGGIYKAKASKVNKELGLVWFDLDDKRDLKGFLNVETIVKKPENMLLSTYRTGRTETYFEESDVVLCQIVKDGVGNKKPTVSTNIMINGVFLILTPFCNDILISRKFSKEEKTLISKKLAELSNGKYGYIVRTAFLEGSDEDILREMNNLEADWHFIKQTYDRIKPANFIYGAESLISNVIKSYVRDSRITEVIVSDPDIYEDIKNRASDNFVKKLIYKEDTDPYFKKFSFTKIIDSLVAKKVELSNGGTIVIDETEALTVIDVNTANCQKKSLLKEEIIFETNMLAAKQIARQIRLRNIGGIIIVDFIDMKSDTDKNRLLDLLRNYTSDDNMRVSVKGISTLGLVEMTRQRRFDTLTSRLITKCPHCEGRGYSLTPQVILNMVHDKIVWDILPKKPQRIHLFLKKEMRDLLEGYVKSDDELRDFINKNNITIHILNDGEGEFFKLLYE